MGIHRAFVTEVVTEVPILIQNMLSYVFSADYFNHPNPIKKRVSHMKKIIYFFAILCFNFCISTAFANSSAPLSLLYVLHANHGKLEETANHHYVLQLTPMHEQVVYFSDRPNRAAGSLTIKNFLALWSAASGKNNFTLDHPNAAIVAVGMNGKQYHQDLVILDEPHYNPQSHQLTFTITALDAHTPVTPFVASEVTVFVDNCNWCGFQPVGG